MAALDESRVLGAAASRGAAQRTRQRAPASQLSCERHPRGVPPVPPASDFCASSSCSCSASGTGAATTVFTVVDAVVLRPLPFAAPDRLVTLWDTNTEKGLAHDPISPVNFMDYRALPVFSDAAAWWRPGVNLVDPGLDPVRVNTIEVSGNIFDVLGVRPQVGAGFPRQGPVLRPERARSPSSAIASGARATAPIRRSSASSCSLNDTPYTVVGVMPPKFHYPGRHRRLAAAAVGPDAAQPRRAFHGSGRAAVGRHDVRRGAERGRSARPAAAGRVFARPTRAGRRGWCRCSTNSSATTVRR